MVSHWARPSKPDWQGASIGLVAEGGGSLPVNPTEGGNLPASQLCLLSAWLCLSYFQPNTLEIVEASAHTD